MMPPWMFNSVVLYFILHQLATHREALPSRDIARPLRAALGYTPALHYILTALERKGLITQAGVKIGPDPGRPRRTFRITPAGREVARRHYDLFHSIEKRTA